MNKRIKKPFDYKTEAFVVQKEWKGHEVEASHRVVIEGDERGFYKKAVIYADGPSWTPKYAGQPLVSLKYFDGDLEFTIHKPNATSTFNMSISDLADLRILVEALNRLGPVEWFSKARIKTAFHTKKIKQRIP